MPPISRYTKEQLVDAAFEIACKQGFDAVTIRGVAEFVGSSIAPIYVNFERVEELKVAVVQKALRLCREMAEGSGDLPLLLGSGLAGVRFARQYPKLFQELVLYPGFAMQARDGVKEAAVIEKLRKDSALAGFTGGELREIVFNVGVFAAGLALHAAVDSEAYPDERVAQLLKDMYEAAVQGMLSRKQNGQQANV